MSELSSQPAPKRAFDSWALVEVMGHTRVAGKCTEESIAGVNMLRVDVPEVTKRTERYDYTKHETVATEKTLPAYTRYFGGSSIFSVTPCSEQVARAAAAENASEPPIMLALPEKSLPAGRAFNQDLDDDDRDEPVGGMFEDPSQASDEPLPAGVSGGLAQKTGEVQRILEDDSRNPDCGINVRGDDVVPADADRT